LDLAGAGQDFLSQLAAIVHGDESRTIGYKIAYWGSALKTTYTCDIATIISLIPVIAE